MATHLNFCDRESGKDHVRLLYVRRAGVKHYVKDIDVSTRLIFEGDRDFRFADHTDVVPTDTQKNTVYTLAKKRGVRTIEDFGKELCEHFLSTYKQVVGVKISIEEFPWQRIQKNGEEHVHGFIGMLGATHFCRVFQERKGRSEVISGINNLKIIKTAKSEFKGFYKDQYCSLTDTDDRIFCTALQCHWTYCNKITPNYDFIRERVKELILEEFAGPPDTGKISLGTTNTVYEIARYILNKMHQIEKIEITLPNVHAFAFDFSKLPKLAIKTNKEVFQPTDVPCGVIKATIDREHKSKL